MPLSTLVLFSQFGQASLSEFVDLYTTRKPGKILHDAKFVGQFVWGNLVLEELTDFGKCDPLSRLWDNARAGVLP